MAFFRVIYVFRIPRVLKVGNLPVGFKPTKRWINAAYSLNHAIIVDFK